MNDLRIETDRLVIRQFKLSDLEDFHNYRKDPEVAKFQGYEPFDQNEARVFILDHADKSFGEPGEWTQYAIEHTDSKTVLGDCAIKLALEDQRLGEVGITISPAHQQKGYAREALTAILDFLFGREDFHRVTETVDAENAASIKLVESVGFRKEGHFIENIFFNGKWGSEMQYAMLRNEWIAKTRKSN
jgi:RimJ/RimL family protein N-acetyltransferase